SACAQNELLRTQCRTDCSGNRVCVDVEKYSGFVRRQWADDGHQTIVQQLTEHCRVDAVDVADKTVVNRFASRGHRHARSPICPHETRIDSADSNGIDVQVPTHTQDSRVDETVEHHRCNVYRFLVRDTASFDHSCRYAQRL